MGGSAFVKNPFEDRAGLGWMSSAFGDLVVGQRRDLVTGTFVHGLPSLAFQRVERWDAAGGAGSLTANERVVGGTSNAVGIVEDVVSPIRIRVLSGVFQSGETITGVGVSAATTGGSRVITKNAAVNGEVTTSNSIATVASGTAATGSCALESAHLGPYSAGHELGSLFTAAFKTDAFVSGVDAFIGMFNRGGANGMGVGHLGSGPGIGKHGLVVRRAGVSTFVPYDQFNIDPFDGNGPSGQTWDPSKINIFRFQMGYLGVYGVLLSIVGTDGKWYPAHFYTAINSGLSAFILDPHLTMRAEVTKTSAGAVVAAAYTASWNVYAVAPTSIDLAPQRPNGYIRASISIATGAERYLFSLLNKLTYAGVANNTPMRLVSASLATDAAGSQSCVFRIRRNAPIAGGTFNDVSALNSCVSVDTAASSGFTGGDVVWNRQLGSSGSGVDDLRGENIVIGPGESITITAETTTTQAIRPALRWEEVH